jgi:hypothetical protein
MWWRGIRADAVGAGEHDLRDAIAEARPDRGCRFEAALVLDGVVQQRCNCSVLVAAPLEHGRCHGHEVRDVGNIVPLARLLAVEVFGEHQRFGEAVSQRHTASSMHDFGRREIRRRRIE